MNEPYRRLAVFVDHPSKDHFLWVIIESTDDPSVWLDLETGDATYDFNVVITVDFPEASEAGQNGTINLAGAELVLTQS